VCVCVCVCVFHQNSVMANSCLVHTFLGCLQSKEITMIFANTAIETRAMETV